MPELAKPVMLHPEAQAELRDSVLFYRERGGEMWATKFKERVADGFKAISASPLRNASVPGMPDVRRFRIKQFPFSLLYINRSDHIWVVAVAHGRRRPGYWRARVG